MVPIPSRVTPMVESEGTDAAGKQNIGQPDPIPQRVLPMVESEGTDTASKRNIGQPVSAAAGDAFSLPQTILVLMHVARAGGEKLQKVK